MKLETINEAKTLKIRLAKTNEQEILELTRFLSEIGALRQEIGFECFEDFFESYQFDKEVFPVMSKIRNQSRDMEEFIMGVFSHLSNIHHWRILANCDALLRNCADPDNDVLDFNPEIKKGLELLEKSQKGKVI